MHKRYTIYAFQTGPKPLPLGEENPKVILLRDLPLMSTITMTQTLDTSMPPRSLSLALLGSL